MRGRIDEMSFLATVMSLKLAETVASMPPEEQARLQEVRQERRAAFERRHKAAMAREAHCQKTRDFLKPYQKVQRKTKR